MAAGLGFKDFTTGEVLTAADVDGYLMQGIWVFTNATARDAAVTSPQEGNFAFTKDNNSLWYYDGAAWVASGATGDIEGVTAGIGISGGGTSGTVTVTNSMATAIDAKGDLVAGTGADTFAKLTVGANDTVLTADSTAATGLKWATPASGGMTLINTGGTALSGASVTVSSIPTTYKELRVILVNIGCTASNYMQMQLNGDTAANYQWIKLMADDSALSAASSNGSATTELDHWFVGMSGNTLGNAIIEFPNYTVTSGSQPCYSRAFSVSNHGFTSWGSYAKSAAITSMTFIAPTGSFNNGTIFIYGVS
jgi:hypothetical protein